HVELNTIITMNLKDRISLNLNLTPLNLEDEIYLNPENEVINLCVFESWESADTIIEAYNKKHRFAIIKKWLIHHENSSIKHHSFGCEFGN
ncbi:9464_t:CDS:2, partial [Funneliformis geosporum]